MIAFVQEPVMIILAVKDTAGRPTIARGVGARPSEAGDLVDVFVSRAQWPDLIAGCAAGAPLAVTFCRPANYRTYQIKGPVLETGDIAPDDHALSRRYMEAMRAALIALGVRDRQIDFWITDRDLVRVRFVPSAAFTQTPGPDAGRILADVPA